MKSCRNNHGTCKECGAKPFEMCMMTWEYREDRDSSLIATIILIAMILAVLGMALLIWGLPYVRS